MSLEKRPEQCKEFPNIVWRVLAPRDAGVCGVQPTTDNQGLVVHH